ncbi:hypothetical protein [Aneurinibacillus terranovensis]|uniref:hypothetical protein n=1 Tax=Aneurinibacillus terranovensis TaxID=278991 RepID=UPI0003F85A3F|nr:hypothetical protein [Aneurinibacillus terranovensis]
MKWNPGVWLETYYSRYRSIKNPLLRFIDQIQHRTNQDYEVAVVLPIFITTKLWHRLLHNQAAFFIERALLRSEDIIIVKVPFHLKK